MARLISIAVFAAIPFTTDLVRRLSPRSRVAVLSVAGGIAASYVFIDLLPELAATQHEVDGHGFMPYIERHVYIAALFGLIVAYGVEQLNPQTSALAARASILGATVTFFIVGYSVATQDDAEIQPFALFIIAMGLHYFVIDEALASRLGPTYHHLGRYFLSGACIAGAILGALMQIDATTLGLLLAFLAGSVVFNTIRHEMPVKESGGDFAAFSAGAVVYSAILLILA